MKPTDSSAYHLPEFDGPFAAREHAGRQRTHADLHRDPQGEVAGQMGHCHREPRHEVAGQMAHCHLSDCSLEALLSEAHGMKIIRAVDEVRRLAADATIGVVLMTKDRAVYDAINFPGQSEAMSEDGPVKTLAVGPWFIELGFLDEDAASPSD